MNKLDAQIAVLKEISSAIVREKNVNTLLDKILTALKQQMGMIHGTFTFLDKDVYRIGIASGISEADKEKGVYQPGEGITGQVAQSGVSMMIPDISKDGRFLNRTGVHDMSCITAFICVPIIHSGRVIGTLSVDRLVTDDANLRQDTAFLEIVGNIAAEAVSASVREREEKESLLSENRQLRDMLTGSTKIIGNSKNMTEVYRLVNQVASSEATVLIRGSSGTGKELVARAIAEMSPRKERPFIALNCAAIPESLVEAELFGHEKGAFTGAVQRRIGRAEAADGGTLFLDEVGDLSLMAQVKLLRFIQERTFSRVGSSQELSSDVRFIAATSRDLEKLISQGKFREDLYYRLNIFPVNMPDLNDRKSDIVLLAEHFIEKYNLKYGRSVSRLSTPAINMLMSYHWPGNVRELENCIERAVITVTDDCIRSYNLPPSLQTGQTSGTELLKNEKASLSTLVDSFERELIVEALKRHNGNMSAAGRDLDLSPRVIHYKIKRLGIAVSQYILNVTG